MIDCSSILVFVKAPKKGKTKSRLVSAVGENTALDIYKTFTVDIVDALRKTPHALKIYFYPHNSRKAVENWLGKDLSYMPQEGKDLGERMANAFVDCFSGGIAKVVLIGSDIPDLPYAMIDEAFSALESNDAVIGPASDGGYYLIGFKRNTFMAGIFREIAWGTSSVYRETMKRFAESVPLVHILPEWHDVDTIDDLRSFFVRNLDTEFKASRSMAICRKIFT